MIESNFNSSQSSLSREWTSGGAETAGNPVGLRITVSDLADRYGLKATRCNGKIEFHGANPWGGGATKDGFILNGNGTAWDRSTNTYYTSKEVAALAGIAPGDYEPVAAWRSQNPLPPRTNYAQSQKQSGTDRITRTALISSPRSLKERGVREETKAKWEIREDGNWIVYPTHHADGGRGRDRYKNRDSNHSRKYWWARSTEPTADQPAGYGLNHLKPADSSPDEAVYVVGGEVDVWIATQAGLQAVSTFGETQGHQNLVNALWGLGRRHIIVVLDNDDAGHTGAVKLKAAAEAAGMACAVKVFSGPKSVFAKSGVV